MDIVNIEELDKYTANKLKEYPERGNLYYMWGLPRSGKSTFAREWPKSRPMRVAVNGDTFRLTTYNKGFILEREEEMRSHYRVAIRSLLLEGYDVLIDDCHTNPEKRKLWDSLGARVIACETPLDVCLGRVEGDPADEEVAGFIKAIKRMDTEMKIHPITDIFQSVEGM